MPPPPGRVCITGSWTGAPGVVGAPGRSGCLISLRIAPGLGRGRLISRNGRETPTFNGIEDLNLGADFCSIVFAPKSADAGASSHPAATETIKAESLFAELRYMPFLRSVK